MKALRAVLVALAAAVLVVVVGAASAFGTVGQSHAYYGTFACAGKGGRLSVQLRFPDTGSRSWKLVGQTGLNPILVGRTGQYAQVTGGGRIRQIGGHASAWSARLEGFLILRNGEKQRIAIALKSRPKGSFVLTPLQPGVLTRDSGTQRSAWSG